RGIEKRYGEVAAVAGFDLELREGEFVSLLGPSGCGKTTTLRMIAGFIEPTAGTIAMDGRVLSSPSGALPPEKRQMSMIFQSYAVWPNMTVEQNVAFGLELRKLPREDVRTRVGAGFIGRTNFIEGTSANGQIAFGTFALPHAALEGAPTSGKVTISVRPQSMRLSRAQSADAGPQVAVTIAERAYLGEFWDYLVTPPDGGMKLRVTTAPLEIYQVGEQ